MSLPLLVGAVVGVLLVILILVFISKYRTSSPDEALIVTGSGLGRGKNVTVSEDGKKMKIIRGGGTFVLPVFQQAETLSLLNHKLEVGTRNTYTAQGVAVNVNGVAIIKIGSTISAISTAAEQYLGKSPDDLRLETREVLEGHLRAILSSMSVEQIYKDREKFSQAVFEAATQDLEHMGLVIVSFTIKEVNDDEGYLDSLGRAQIERVKSEAQIETAKRQKEARIQRALAEKEAQEFEIERATEIEEANKNKELKVQGYKKEQEQARADADQSYKLQEAKIQQQVKEEEMKIKIIEREKQIELEEKEIARREKQYDAEVKKKADADRYAIEQSAEAEKAREISKAEAEKFKITTQAEANADKVRLDGLAQADIEKAAGQAHAEATLAKGKADADITRLKGLAEAEAKQKVAEAFEQFGQAAILDMIIKMLPEYAKQVASPLANIDKITVVDTGGNGENSGANKITGYATNLMASLQESLKASSGLDVKELIENFSGKGNVKSSLENLTEEVKKSNQASVATLPTPSTDAE